MTFSYCPLHGSALTPHDRIGKDERYTCEKCGVDVIWWADGDLLFLFKRLDTQDKRQGRETQG